jgi:outer membrane protein TolC
MTDLSAADRSATLANASSEHTLSLATQRYRDGVANSLDVIEAQQTALVQQRLVTTIRGREFAQCVFLLKAIGGGWDAGTGTQATNLRTASSKPDKQAS